MKSSWHAIMRYVAGGDPLKLIICLILFGVLIISVMVAVSAQKPNTGKWQAAIVTDR